jgi:hypothetical protein
MEYNGITGMFGTVAAKIIELTRLQVQEKISKKNLTLLDL